jgi:hypothetical protein
MDLYESRRHADLRAGRECAGNYDVSVVPHWDVSAAAIERFDGAVTAFERHAELARYLRENGWHLTSRLAPQALRAA